VLALDIILALRGEVGQGKEIPWYFQYLHLVDKSGKKSPKSTEEVRDFPLFSDYIYDESNS
jgi:hypothetical protein